MPVQETCECCSEKYDRYLTINVKVLDSHLCNDCQVRAGVWAAKQALAAERSEKLMGGNLSITLDPRALTEWPGNCAPPEFGKLPSTEVVSDVLPNVLGSNAQQLPATLFGRPIVWVDEFGEPSSPPKTEADPFYVKQREDWRNEP